MAPQFSLSIQSVELPALPQTPIDDSVTIRSGLIPSILRATTPLYFTCALPLARPKNPLYPATHLQLGYSFQDTGEIFIPHFITPEHLVHVENTDDLFEIQVSVEDIPRAKVNHGATSTATVSVYAWKDEKLLGQWEVCKIEGLGLEGFKSNGLALLRAKTQENMRLRP